MCGVCVGGLIGLYVKVELLLLLVLLILIDWLIDWLIRGERKDFLFIHECVVCSLSNNLVNEHRERKRKRERKKLTMFVFLLFCQLQKFFYRYFLLIYKRKFSLFFSVFLFYLQEVINADLNKKIQKHINFTRVAIIKIPYLSKEQIETSSWASA